MFITLMKITNNQDTITKQIPIFNNQSPKYFPLNSKFEILNPKQIRNPNFLNSKLFCFGHANFGTSKIV